jgi:hypothetical protein
VKELAFAFTLGAELVLGAILVWSIARPGARV